VRRDRPPCLPLNSTELVLIVGLGFAGISVLILLAINIVGFVRPGWTTIRAGIADAMGAESCAPSVFVE
jgi:hypothetical protein